MDKEKLVAFFKYFHPAIAGLIILVIYAITIAPSVIQIDSGELAAVQLTLGIAHPTGYPLFTVLGFIFSHLPIPVALVAKMNILAALWSTAGIIVFIYTAELILKHLSAFTAEPSVSVKGNNKKKKQKEKNSAQQTDSKPVDFRMRTTIIIFTALAAGFVLALNKTYWFQSTSVEVYSLHAMLMMLIIHVLLRARLNALSEYPNDIHWYIFAFMLALGFSNHMTTILILPGVAYIYFITYRFDKAAFSRIVRMLFIFFTTLFFLYSYLPIRALQGPSINWGNPVSLESILRHISGKQYQVWIFSSTEAARKQFLYFINQLPIEFTINLIFVAVGLVYSFLKARKIFVFLIISLISTVLYAINYDIVDIDSYFLLAYISMAFFSVFGLYLTFMWLGDKFLKLILPASLVVLFLTAQIYLTYGKVNQSDNFVVKDYTTQILLSADKNSIILSYQWDFFISASYYFQYVEKMRTDVKIIDKELLRRSWYFNQMKKSMPNVTDKIAPEISVFLNLLSPFEKDEVFNAKALETAYRNLMMRIIETNLDTKTIYIAPELVEGELKRGEFLLPEGTTLIPDLFFYRIVKDNQYVQAPLPTPLPMRFPKHETYYTQFIYKNSASMLTQRIVYEMQFNQIERAKIYFERLKTNFPDYPLPKGLAESLR